MENGGRTKDGRKRRGKERRMKNMTKRDRIIAKAIIRCDAMREGDEENSRESGES